MLTALALIALGVPSPAAAAPAPAADVVVTLPASASSRGLEILARDVAVVRGDDVLLVERVSAASLGYAPAPGYARVLRADLVEASLRRSFPGVDLEVRGAARCRVTPEVTTVTAGEISAKASDAMRAALAGVDAKAVPDGGVADLQVPKGDGELRLVASAGAGPLVPGLRQVEVQVWVGPKLYRTLHVPFRLEVWQRRAVLRGAINVGEALRPDMFEIKRIPVRDSSGLHALEPDMVAGAIATRPLGAGSFVTEHDVHRRVVIEQGDQITVRVKKGSVAVQDVAIAEGEGRMGERVVVRLRSTGRQLVAVVRGPQLAEVEIQ